MALYAVVALVKAPDDATHEQVYDLVNKQFPDSDALTVTYLDVDPDWRSHRVLAENAEGGVMTRMRKRVHIHKDVEPDPVYCWYYTVEYDPPREDALDYGSMETWQLAMSNAESVLRREHA